MNTSNPAQLNELQKLSVYYTALIRQLKFTQHQLTRYEYKVLALEKKHRETLPPAQYSIHARKLEAVYNALANALTELHELSAAHRNNMRLHLTAKGLYRDPKKKHYEKRKAATVIARSEGKKFPGFKAAETTDNSPSKNEEIQ